MKNATIVKVLALLIANLFLVSSMIGSAGGNPIIDQLKADTSQTHDTHSYSYYKDQKSWDSIISPDRHLTVTVKEDGSNQSVPNFNMTVTWSSRSAWSSDFVTGAAWGAVIGAVIAISIVTFFVFPVFGLYVGGAIYGGAAGHILGIGLVGVGKAIVVGAVAGGIIGGLASSQQHGVNERINAVTDANGKFEIIKSWQDDVDILVNIGVEPAVSGYTEFKPNGQPHWTPHASDPNQCSKNGMSVDVYLVSRDTEGGYLANLRIAQNKVRNLTYVGTDDGGNYEDTDSNFEALNMHESANAENYADICEHPEWNSTNFWRGRASVYPDGLGSDILWIETRRLFYIKDASGVTDFGVNASYKDGYNNPIQQGYPAGAFYLDDTSELVTPTDLATGKYIYEQFIWVVGKADLRNPSVTVDVYFTVNGGTPVEAGSETIEIPSPQHIICFTFSDSSLIDSVHHTVYAERSIPTVHGDLQFNLYSDGDIASVQASGIQSLAGEWDTGGYGMMDLYHSNCSYPMYFAIENEDGDEVLTSPAITYDFDNDTITKSIADIDVSTLDKETSYRLTWNNQYFGANMSSTLFYQLTDWDSHSNLTQQMERLINETFALTGAGQYGNFDTYHVNKIMSNIGLMSAKVQIQEARLNDFIQAHGESNYTKNCAKDIMYFKFFYNYIQKYAGKTPTEIATNPADFAQFRGLCNVINMAFNHIYLYYSCSVAFEHGDLELCDDLTEMMAYEDNLIEDYYYMLKPSDVWDLTLIVMLIIALIIASVATYGAGKYYNKSSGWKTTDKKKIALIFGGLFAAVFALSFGIMYIFAYGWFHGIFGAIPKVG